ncbi:MAG TPA: 16S rRNA (uracil(1498)-N(3))-methyltransferase [Idiomarina baltica]|uniref:Ribosomal RNA small subunit methyltransferase E n=1 Tax=Idiomarina baltica TaxID=190892 RepID=A0A348WQJ1_9GAMM|nr:MULTISPECIES: 16S rRNA (uracil(1498)-N(3))-methyltransferase [Idiomarina]MBL74775.1 16S rRNA (uracil(1498)-N(3))-methyltransferase [Idiomarinaceae bacterium]HAR56803.1 16S rRNA (uracil(1498)-N(3))-methyltransferase [Idiomarina baltica]
MRVPRIFHPEPLMVNSTVSLSDDAFQHTIKVLRMQEGQALELFCNDEFNYPAVLTSVAKKSAQVEIIGAQLNNTESPLFVHLGQVVSRGDRMDFALQKSVELGVNAITPLFSERCGVKLNGDRLEKKQQQWQKIVISACEQSGRSHVPTVLPAVSVDDFVQTPFDGLRLTLDPYAQVPLNQIQGARTAQRIQLIIGPEGGFTDIEVEHARNNSFKPIRLGPRILRTETAAMTALAAIQYEFGDLNASNE